MRRGFGERATRQRRRALRAFVEKHASEVHWQIGASAPLRQPRPPTSRASARPSPRSARSRAAGERTADARVGDAATEHVASCFRAGRERSRRARLARNLMLCNENTECFTVIGIIVVITNARAKLITLGLS